MGPKLKAAFEAEMLAATRHILSGALESASAHLQRAHILGQPYMIPHARTHYGMLRIAFMQRKAGAALGQLVRLPLGIIGSAIGWVPTGNSGASDVGMFARQDIDPALADLIESDGRPRR